jgi:glucokinase
LSAAAFGVAGPVSEGVSRITNLPWEISQSSLAGQLHLSKVALINDLEAQAWGIDDLDSGELLTLQAGTGPATGNRAIVAAGTGLGEAGLCDTGAGHRPFATEGGHSDFAAISERDWLLRQHLRERYGHVSWERLLSGPGLVALYQFLLSHHRAPAPDWLTAPDEVPAAHITDLALGQQDAICVETLRWFVQLYGREAGNIALKLKATGGVYLGGGIAPRILPALRDGLFIEAYLDKGRMRALLERIPVRVICSDLVALKGLTRLALGATDSRAT